MNDPNTRNVYENNEAVIFLPYTTYKTNHIKSGQHVAAILCSLELGMTPAVQPTKLKVVTKTFKFEKRVQQRMVYRR